jgi:hypothetical protein
MREEGENYYEGVDEVCQLIENHWDWLTEEEQSAVELANNSMSFFLELNDFDRFTWEYNTIKKIIKQAEF